MPFTNITGRVVAVHTINQSLRIHLQNFVHGLVQSKNFYGTLADTLCNDDSLAVRSESNCWNGDAIGE